MAAMFSFEHRVDNWCWYKMEACSIGQTELSRFMVPDSSNRMISPADSGFKMEEDHLNNSIVDRSVCFNASTLTICGNMWLNKNILKMHPNRVPTFKKLCSGVLFSPASSLEILRGSLIPRVNFIKAISTNFGTWNTTIGAQNINFKT